MVNRVQSEVGYNWKEKMNYLLVCLVIKTYVRSAAIMAGVPPEANVLTTDTGLPWPTFN